MGSGFNLPQILWNDGGKAMGGGGRSKASTGFEGKRELRFTGAGDFRRFAFEPHFNDPVIELVVVAAEGAGGAAAIPSGAFQGLKHEMAAQDELRLALLNFRIDDIDRQVVGF